MYLAGLPFKGANLPDGAQEQWGANVSWINNWDWTASYSINGIVRNDEKYIRFYYIGANNSPNVTVAQIDRANSQMYISGQYRTNED